MLTKIVLKYSTIFGEKKPAGQVSIKKVYIKFSVQNVFLE